MKNPATSLAKPKLPKRPAPVQDMDDGGPYNEQVQVVTELDLIHSRLIDARNFLREISLRAGQAADRHFGAYDEDCGDLVDDSAPGTVAELNREITYLMVTIHGLDQQVRRLENL